MKTQSRLDVLTGYLNLWVHVTNKQHVAASIVETLDKSGFRETMEAEGISFTQAGDTVDQARKNAQKLWRWLGQYDGVETNKERLFDLEQIIVAAFPLDLRVAYLTNIYGDSELAISPIYHTQEHQIDLKRMIQIMMKEDTEAHLAVMDLTENKQNPVFIEKTRAEIREAISVHVCVLNELDMMVKALGNSH